MAQKAIREHFGKKLLYKFLPEYFSEFTPNYVGVLVDAGQTAKLKLFDSQKGYIVKPDELFGKRGKNNLIYHANSAKDATSWIKDKSAKPVTVKRNKTDKGITGPLHNFLIEPFVEHKKEFYLGIKTEGESDVIYFSEAGGIDIEENWSSVKEMQIPFSLNTQIIAAGDILKQLKLKNNPENLLIAKFISGIYACFRELDFTYLEINPFTIVNGEIYLLDLVARLDDTALYRKYGKWQEGGKVEFPHPFGTKKSNAELLIEEMDNKSGASLKLSIINPEGRIWMLTSGGGGSVVFADTVGDLGSANELANYGEYSGNPSADETETYTDIVLKEMLKSKAENKILIIGGGIANFTDIKETFTGVIKALRKNATEVKKQKIKIYVRRGGPNYKQGLEIIKTETAKLGIYIEVYGPETYMTHVVSKAVKGKQL